MNGTAWEANRHQCYQTSGRDLVCMHGDFWRVGAYGKNAIQSRSTEVANGEWHGKGLPRDADY